MDPRIPRALLRCIALGLAASAGLVFSASADEPDMYSINFHFAPPEYAGCSEVLYEDARVSCDFLDTDYDETFPLYNWTWIFVGGVSGPDGPGIGGIQFGIEYDGTVRMSSWALCTGGSEIPQNDGSGRWPDSGTGNAMTWSGGCYRVTENDDGVTMLGFFVFLPQSSGLIRFTGDPRVGGEAHGAGCDALLFEICDALLGVGDFEPNGTGDVNTCGWSCSVPLRETTWSALKERYR